jgi:hypothetical protein
VAAPLDLAAGPPLPMAARFAGLAICRHLYALSGSNIKSNRGDLIVLTISVLAPLALGAFAIASTLAPQRFFSERLRAWRLA